VRDAVLRYGRVYQAERSSAASTRASSERPVNLCAAAESASCNRYTHTEMEAASFGQNALALSSQSLMVRLDLYLGPAPWLPYDGITGPHRFDIGELNWGQHHYDIIQWAADADDTGPVEIFMEEGRSGYKYASGVVLYGKGYPGEPIGGEGGACFVGTHGRLAVDRNALVSDPPDIVSEPLRPNELHLYHSESHSGNFLECVRTRKQTICNIKVAQRAASALLLGGVAKQLNRTVKWDPQLEYFPATMKPTAYSE